MWPWFVAAQARNGNVVVGITHQVIATDTLDGHDIAGLQCRHAGRQCGIVIGNGFHARCGEFKCRATGRTGDRLGMKAPVVRVGVFPAAVCAQFEGGHGSGRAIVGHAADQRVTWPTLGAVDKWILIAPVLRIVQFREAVVAGEQVRWHVDIAGVSCRTLADGEVIEVIHGGRFTVIKDRP